MGISKTKGGLGFRDLISFNKALLAKQYWRLLQNLSSLAAHIMKGKYFHQGFLLEAAMCKRPSFAWRSMWSARELLKEGICLGVGDGRTAHI